MIQLCASFAIVKWSCVALAATHRFNEIVIGVPLGPEIAHVIELWGTEILPGMR